MCGAALKDDSHPVNQMDKVVAYSDGSLENDLPMQQLSELFNVNHFIVSQVNPHSAILSSMALKASVWSNPVYGALVGYDAGSSYSSYANTCQVHAHLP